MKAVGQRGGRADREPIVPRSLGGTDLLEAEGYFTRIALGLVTTIPEVMVPSQFFRRAQAPSQPEMALMCAVLEDAVRVWRKYHTQKHPKARFLAHEAREWMESQDRRSPFAFLNICAAVGFDPQAVLGAVFRGHLRPTPKRTVSSHPSGRGHIVAVGSTA